MNPQANRATPRRGGRAGGTVHFAHERFPMSGAITVTVNGRDRHVLSNSSVLELLTTLELDPRAVVVEHNRDIIRRPELGSTILSEGDCVEIVHFVGGG